jgi:hypothetical protein
MVQFYHSYIWETMIDRPPEDRIVRDRENKPKLLLRIMLAHGQCPPYFYLLKIFLYGRNRYQHLNYQVAEDRVLKLHCFQFEYENLPSFLKSSDVFQNIRLDQAINMVKIHHELLYSFA